MNKRRVTKEVPKKMKNYIIKGDESEEDEEDKMTRIKWRDFEVHLLIAIRDKICKNCKQTR
jgi:hypothetical protein